MNLVFPTLAVLASWLCISAMLIGLGLGLIALVRLPQSSSQFLLTAFWLGFAVVLALLQCWHFFFRISAMPWILFSLAAIPGIWKSRNSVFEFFAAVAKHPLTLALSVLAILYVINRSLGPCLAFDSGLYGQPAVKWFTTYPVVPGLANLQERLGFNNSIFLFYAMFDQGFWHGRSNQLVNGLLLSALLLQVIWSSARLLDRDNPEPGSNLFDAVLLIPALFIAVDAQFFNVASIVTDPAAAIMMLVAASRLFRILRGRSENPATDGFFVIVIVVAAVTIKLSAVAFAATAALLVCWSWFRLSDTETNSVRRTASLSAFAAALLMVPWMVRGAILSGYAIYPIALSATNLDWRVPESVALRESGFIREFAEYYYDPNSITDGMVRGQYRSPSGSWIMPWILRSFEFARGEVVIPTALTLVGLLLLVGFPSREGGLAHLLGFGWLAFIPALALLIQCILLGPSPRFMFAGFWVLAALAMSIGLEPLVLRSAIVRRDSLAMFCIIAGLLVSGHALRLFVRRQPAVALAVLFNPPGPDGGFYDLPKADFSAFVTRSGLTVLSPVKDGRIWNGPLVSAPDPVADLALRFAGDPRYGFRTDATPAETVSR
jgi:hypothetical protein